MKKDEKEDVNKKKEKLSKLSLALKKNLARRKKIKIQNNE